MRRRLMILSTLIAAVAFITVGLWWVWRTYYSAEQFNAALFSGLENKDFSQADTFYAWGADTEGMGLHYPVLRGNVDVVQSMIASGANVSAKDGGGYSPLFWAAMGDRLEIITILIEAGADVNEGDDDGITPLHQAVVNARLDYVTVLINAGAKVNAENSFGITPLHYSVEYGQIAITKLLLANGADLHIKNKRGKTALDTANDQGLRKIATILEIHLAKQKAPAPAKAP